MTHSQHQGHTEIKFFNPFVVCESCGVPVQSFHDGDECGCRECYWHNPCGHNSDPVTLCPSWNPRQGCRCVPEHGVADHDPSPLDPVKSYLSSIRKTFVPDENDHPRVPRHSVPAFARSTLQPFHGDTSPALEEVRAVLARAEASRRAFDQEPSLARDQHATTIKIHLKEVIILLSWWGKGDSR